MKKIRNLVLILVILLSFNGCEKNPAEVESVPVNAELTVDQAKSFVDNQRLNQFTLKGGDLQKQTINVRANWTKSKSSKNEKVSVVETEIQALGRFGFATPESMQASEETNNEAYTYTTSRLVVIKHKESGEMYSFIMSVVGDKQYLEGKKFMIGDNSYLKRDKDLSGIVLFHSISGEFVNGWVYCDGQITNSIIATENMDLPVQLKSTETMLYVYEWVESCTDWYLITEISISYTGASCSTRLVYVGSYNTSSSSGTSGDTGSTGGGTAGGYVPPTPCSCTNICPVCHKCLDNTLLKSVPIPGGGGTTTTVPCEMCAGHPVPNIDIDGYNNLNSSEKELIKKFPLEALKIAENREKAVEMTINLFNHNGLNDCSDAFRHAYFQALNTISIGSFMTQKFSDAHESDTPTNLLLEKQMDLLNNSFGNYIGNNCSGCNVTEKIMEALTNGELYFLSPIDLNDSNFSSTHGITSQTRLVSSSNCN
jgi:hypothetical protein